MLLRWNGGGWSPIAQPRAALLKSFSQPSFGPMWAITFRPKLGFQLTRDNGHTWTNTPITSTSTQHTQILAVTSITPTDAWAVGVDELPHHFHPVIYHWNGADWMPVT